MPRAAPSIGLYFRPSRRRDPETARYGLKGNVELSDAQVRPATIDSCFNGLISPARRVAALTRCRVASLQKAFLARKKQMAAGEEVEVPTGPGGACSECGGAGERVCPACSGSGVNAKGETTGTASFTLL